MHDAMMLRIEANGGHGMNYGKHFSEEARRNNAIAQKKIADVHRQSRLGSKMTPESIAKRTATRISNNGGVYTINTTSKKIQCIETGEIIPSISELSRRIGISQYLVTRLIEKSQEHNGKHYIFLKENERYGS